MSHEETMPTNSGLGHLAFAIFSRLSRLCIDPSSELTFLTAMTSHHNEKKYHNSI